MAAERDARWGRRGAIARWIFLLCALGSWRAAPPRASDCELAFAARTWDLVVTACGGERWIARRQLAAAYLEYARTRDEAVLSLVEPLLSSSEATDAAYLAGYIRAQSQDAQELGLARARLEQALRGYLRRGHHAQASSSAGLLARIESPAHSFDDSLAMAQLAVTEAARTKDVRAQGRAAAIRAEVYDSIGMEPTAREEFLRAEDLLQDLPAEIANVYFKHAVFLLDLGEEENLKASLALLDRAERADQASPFPLLRFAIPLNRADALSQLGQVEEAARALALAEEAMSQEATTEGRQTKIHLVAGYLAVRRGDPQKAEQLFHLAERQDESDILADDYPWRVAHQLAQAYREAGQPDRAETLLRTAIAVVERIRGRSAKLELRPWMLARRSLPHQALLSLLVELRRDAEALALAESLHARTWLDSVLATRSENSAAHALTSARIRARLDAIGGASDGASATASSPATADSLLTALGDREALVYVPIDDVIWRAHVQNGTVAFHRLPADTASVVAAFRKDPDSPAARAAASQRLLPVELSQRRDPLYVVANGPLEDVPFAALEQGRQPLITSRPISRLPGLAALRCAPTVWGTHSVLLGDSRHNLPHAAREVSQLAARLATVAHTGDAATRQALQSARDAALLHIATHGVATEQGQSLALADGNLTAADVLDEKLAPRLAVLSGCATAASTAPESWNGFPSAFLAAGSRYVIATVRTVDDKEAALLIEAYYAQPETLDPVARLAAAQAQLARTAPAHAWAYFSAWGNAGCDDAAASPVAPTAPAAALAR